MRVAVGILKGKCDDGMRKDKTGCVRPYFICFSSMLLPLIAFPQSVRLRGTLARIVPLLPRNG